MPIGTPSVPYRLPGSQMERWVDIYTRLGVERILFLGQEVSDGVANSLVAQIPLRRLGQPEDCAKVVEFLVTDLSGYVTGQCIPVCGGVVAF